MPGQGVVQLDSAERACLDSVPLLAGMPDTILRRLAKEPKPLNLERGTFLFHQGSPKTDVYVLLHGWVKLFRMGEAGTETIIRIAGAGEVLGDNDLMLRNGHQMCAETISAVRIFTLDGERLGVHLRRDPAMALRLAASLSAQIQTLTQHVEEIKLLDALQRTAHFLLALCPDQAGACRVSLPYEKSVIAGWLGMKPASLSRALARLRRFGVTVDRDAISITDTRRLAALLQLGETSPASRL